MSKALSKITAAVNRGFACAAIVLLVVVVLAMFTQVFSRYILNASLTGSEELSRYCFVWMNFLGAGICVGKYSNASVSILNDALKGRLKELHVVFTDAVILAIGALLLGKGFALSMAVRGQNSSTLGIPMWLVYLSIAVGGAGISLNALNNMIGRTAKMLKQEVAEK